MMIAIRNSDGSNLCHTLALKLGDQTHPVQDYSSFEEAQKMANLINGSGYVIIVSEHNPTLYTTGTVNDDRFSPKQDFLNFDKAVQWCTS